MSYGNWKHNLGVFIFQNSVSNDIFVIKHTLKDPRLEQHHTRCYFWWVSSMALFTKVEHSHLQITLISIQVPPQAKRSSPYPHFFMHYFTDPSSANPHRHVMVTQCFKHQPNRSPRPLSQLFSQKSEGILYIWAIYISNLLVIARYFASFTSNQGLVMKFASLFFFFLFLLCLMFGCSHLIWSIETHGDGFSTRGEPVCFSIFFFSLCLVFGFSHLICSILVLVVMGFQLVVMKFTSFTSRFLDPC